MIKENCEICKGEGWICPVHKTAWEYGNAKCCGAAGAPCSCNPMAHHGFVEVFEEVQEKPEVLQ
jgi:hypothetical protein